MPGRLLLFRLFPFILALALVGCNGGGGDARIDGTGGSLPSVSAASPEPTLPPGPFNPTPTPTPVAPQVLPTQVPSLNASAPWVFTGGAGFDDAESKTNVTGRVASILVSPDAPDVIFVGTAQGGVWKTTDGGQTWSPRSDFAHNLAIGALALDPGNHDHMYAGTGEPNDSALSLYGNGILVSPDAGNTWTLQPGTDTLFSRVSISRLITFRDGDGHLHVVAGTYKSTVHPNNDFDYGVYESVDDGDFHKIFPAAEVSYSVSDLAFEPQQQALYVGVDRDLSGNDENGIWVREGAGAFTHVTDGLPAARQMKRIELAPAADGSRMYAHIGAADGNKYLGVYFTTNQTAFVRVSGQATVDGKTVPYERLNDEQSSFDMPIVVDPMHADRVYFAGNLYLGRLDGIDAGSGAATDVVAFPTRTESTPHPDVHVLVFDGFDEPRLYAGTDGGVWRLDGPTHALANAAWDNLNGRVGSMLFTLQCNSLAVDPSNFTRYSAGTQDNGSNVWLGNTLSRIVLTADGGHTVVDGQRGVVYVTTQRPQIENDFLQRVSFNGGQITLTNYTTGIAPSDPAEFYPPVTQHPTAPDRRMAVGTNRVYERKETDPAFAPVSAPLNGDITALAYAPSDMDVLYAATENGRVYVRLKAGLPFELRASGLPAARINQIAVDPRAPGSAYVVIPDFSNRVVFFTSNYGQTWTDITNNLPHVPIHAIALDGTQSMLPVIYVGAEQQVYASRNAPAPDGITWQRFGTGLPNVQAFALDVENGVLSVGTHGRGVWQIPLLQGVAVTTPPSIQLVSQIARQPAEPEGADKRARRKR